MNLKIAVIGLILVAACLSGCTEKATTDTYRCTVDDGVLYLKGDETYRMLIDEMYGGGGIHGTYGIEEGRVLLDSVLNTIIPFAIDGRDLIDPDGDRWVRD
jgi:hypothetical protein